MSVGLRVGLCATNLQDSAARSDVSLYKVCQNFSTRPSKVVELVTCSLKVTSEVVELAACSLKVTSEVVELVACSLKVTSEVQVILTAESYFVFKWQQKENESTRFTSLQPLP